MSKKKVKNYLLYLSSISLPCVFRVAVFFIYVKYKVFIPLFSGILTKPSTPQEFEFLPIIHNIILDDYNATKIKVSAISTYFEIPSMDCLSKLKAHKCIQLVLRLRMGRGSVDRNWAGEEGNIWKILIFTIMNCDIPGVHPLAHVVRFHFHSIVCFNSMGK